nr:hypothetical protein [Tanacetum cinerariifolium]
MRTRRSYFPQTATIPRHSRKQTTNVVKPEIHTIVEMADNRTMVQMLQAPIEGYKDAIVVPPINANNFELNQIFFIIAVQTPGSGISILLAVETPSTGSGNLYCQWELSPSSGNTLHWQWELILPVGTLSWHGSDDASGVSDAYHRSGIILKSGVGRLNATRNPNQRGDDDHKDDTWVTIKKWLDGQQKGHVVFDVWSSSYNVTVFGGSRIKRSSIGGRKTWNRGAKK